MLLLTVANARGGGLGEHDDAMMASSDGQTGGHDSERGSGRPLDRDAATAPRLANKADADGAVKPELFAAGGPRETVRTA